MKKSSKNIDMCTGSLAVNILRFTLPFMLTGLLQSLYNAADVVVVGRYAGQEALAGVGTTGSITNLILNLFIGLSSGVSVTIGRALGAKNDEDAQRTVHTSMALSIIGGFFISIFGIVFAEPLLRLIDVPDNVMPQAKIYMQIMFTGKIPMFIYNFGSAILRAKGDTKRPLYIVMASGVVNVVLNIIFVTQFGMKADGVALATVIAQIINAVSVLYLLCKDNDNTKLYLRKMKIYKKQIFDIIKVGLPAGIQSVIFALSNVIVQSSVNSFGSAAIAGNSASANIGTFYYIVLNSFFHTCIAFVSQNIGARKFHRIPRIIGMCLAYVCVVWLIEALIVIFGAHTLIGMYVPGDEEAIKVGVLRFMIVGGSYGLCGIMEVISGALRGVGHSLDNMILSIAGVCGIRILWIMTVFQKYRTFETLYISYPISWIMTSLINGIAFMIIYRLIKKKEGIQDNSSLSK